MNHCTLYLALPPGQDVIALFQERFPRFKLSGNVNDGPLTLTKKNILSRRSISFSWRSPEREAEAFTAGMQGMYAFFAAIETPHKNVQGRLLAHMQMINFMAAITSPKEIEQDEMVVLLGMAGNLGGFVLFPPCDLYTSDGELLMDGNGNSELDDYAVTIPSAILDQHVASTEAGERRKGNTNNRLEREGVPICAGLPPIAGDEDARIRTKEEIAERAAGIVMMAMYAECLLDENSVEESRAHIASIMRECGAEQCLSPQEKAFIENDTPDQSDITDYMWRYECYWVALWALGYVEKLEFPDSVCNVSTAVSFLHDAGALETFTKKATLRSTSTILDEADLIYRYDWACVDARIKGQPAPAGLDAGVVVERHRMLNWITCYLDQDWDDVRTDT